MIRSCKKPPVYFPTVTGSIVTFNSQYAGLPLKSHSVEVVATQSGSGTPSPSNPRPITGYSAINISHSDADTSNPTVYTITIGSTVYGGEYDAITGILTVTHEHYKLSDLNWNYYGVYLGNNLFYSDDLIGIIAHNNTDLIYGMFSDYQMIANRYADSMSNFQGRIRALDGRLYINDNRYNSAEAYQSALTNEQLVSELATPQAIQLPPCPIDTLLGENNIWADTGNTTLEYLKAGR